MQRLRNMSQMKEQKKIPDKELNKMEANYQIQSSKLIIKMFKKINENFKELRISRNLLSENVKSMKKGPVRNDGYTN